MKPLPKLLVIVGPTGTGKTALANDMAKKFNGELISADSRQVYIGMDIGTGKEVELLREGEASKENCFWLVREIPIYLYDVVTPDKAFTLVDYQQLAVQKIEEITKEGKLPILVGGTGLYVQSVVDGLKIPKAKPDPELREKLSSKTSERLYEELYRIDPLAAKTIDAKNHRRVVRALEVFYQTGKSINSLKEKFHPSLDILLIGLTSRRENLYQRNDLRVQRWFELGFVQEVEDLLKKYSPNLPSLSALGYGQVALYLEDKISLEKAKERIKFAYHNFIRKQLAWFRRDSRIIWFDIEDPNLVGKVEDLTRGWYTQK